MERKDVKRNRILGEGKMRRGTNWVGRFQWEVKWENKRELEWEWMEPREIHGDGCGDTT